MKPRLVVRHADGSEDVIEGRFETFEVPVGAIPVDCSMCPTGPRGERTGLFVDVLDPRLPEGPFLCPDCEAKR